jgi:deoxyribodipyrimidine photo-lyase
MKNINSKRVFKRNEQEVRESGEYVLYWMQINRRFHYNFALEYAVAWANKLDKPLLIFEGLSCDYPWRTERSHWFNMQGMQAHQKVADEKNLNYYSFLEEEAGQYPALFQELVKKSALIITDEYPVFIMRERNERIPGEVDVPYITVDANGIIPLGVSDSAPYSAYIFRKTMQKYFLECFEQPPKENPLEELEHTEAVSLPEAITQTYPDAQTAGRFSKEWLAGIDVDHSVKPLDIDGSREGGLQRLEQFLDFDLKAYGEERNHPDKESTSRLSPWLHFGKLSEHEIVMHSLRRQPRDWSRSEITPQKGKRDGFFGGDPSIEGFLDEVITWREVGFHFAHHVPNYDSFDSLPDWAQKTLLEHEGDERPYLYSYEEFANARTHDDIWNAAQRQLVRDGRIHNYLRMLWGKKVLEWTPDVQTAIEYLIKLNNTYAIDGRDPNSYSGIFWIFGRFDRAWGPERKMYGKIRYMTSKSTRSKVRLKEYLAKYASM